MLLRVAIGAGHRHTLGEQGNAFEKMLNGQKVAAILAEYKRRGGSSETGIDLRSYTPGNGLGLFPGYLNQAPASLVNSAFQPHIMCELHSEGTDPDVRGAFVIFPDWKPDIDGDTRDHGRIFPDVLTQYTGGQIRVRNANGPGIMSERSTGVGLQGFRLGVFRDTAPARGYCTRMIFEQGAHSNPKERAYMEGPNFLQQQARAFLDALVQFSIVAQVGPYYQFPWQQAVDGMAVPTGGKIGDEYEFGNARWKRNKRTRVKIANGVMIYAGFTPTKRPIPAFEVDDDGGAITRDTTFEQQGGPYLVISGGYMVRENHAEPVK